MKNKKTLGIRDRFKVLIGGKIDQKNYYGGSRSRGYSVPFYSMSGDDETYINDGYAKNDDLYSIIDYICTLAASLDKQLVEILPDGTEQEVTDNDFIKLLNNPSPGMNYNLFVQQAIGFRLLTGDGYVYAPRLVNGVNAGRTTEMLIPPSQHMVVEKTDKELFSSQLKYGLTYGGKKFEFPDGDIGHFKARQFIWEGDDRFKGMSPLKAGLMRLSSSNSAMLNKAARFQNSGADGIVGTKNDDASLDDVVNMEDAYMSKYGGPANSGRIVWTNLDTTYQRFGLSPADLEILKSMQVDLQAFARMYRLDAHLIDANVPSTYNNVRESKAAAYTMATIPILQEFFDMLNEWIVPAYANEGQVLKLKVNAKKVPELQKDLETMSKALNQIRWAVTINEARKFIDLPEYDDPDADIPEGLKQDPGFVMPEPTKKE